MPTAEDLAAAVRARTDGTPYRIVDERPDGFTVRLDRPDVAWWRIFSHSYYATLVTHEVRVLPDGLRVELTDVVRDTHWALDADGRFVEPERGWVRSVSRGSISSTFTASIADDESGARTRVLFDTAAGRRIVTEAAQSLGLSVGASARNRAATIVSLVAAGVGLAVALAAAVLALTLGRG
ncbi:hypothetical protein [Cellulosimicrobium cellulans]|uniref:hypothetical protein n=1 Tax=Cellulosimicrobium cellulans TaxID=1710 RepID=UPI002097D428|nr:hypothetical protein [Cellulosimicrobium cellulans]MCO7274868.1 hypothetical protein [Cellulosimicrobium cellulans]